MYSRYAKTKKRTQKGMRRGAMQEYVIIIMVTCGRGRERRKGKGRERRKRKGRREGGSNGKGRERRKGEGNEGKGRGGVGEIRYG